MPKIAIKPKNVSKPKIVEKLEIVKKNHRNYDEYKNRVIRQLCFIVKKRST